MIKLYGSGPRWGLPDPSPFVVKAEILLKMSGVPYSKATGDFRKAPKGKIPYIEADGKLLGDSTFIRFYLEDRQNANFDGALTAEQKAVALAFETLCEERLYWAIVMTRWMNTENFEKGPKTFFDDVPAPMRPIILTIVSRRVKRNLWGQGLGRHAPEDVERLAKRDIDALAAFLGSKPFLMGANPCGADASVWSTVASLLCRHFETPIRDHTERHANLVAYRDRGLQLWFPELAKRAAK